MKMEILNKI